MTEPRPCTPLAVADLAIDQSTGYPPPFRLNGGLGSRRQVLGDAAGLTQFGVNVLLLAPGERSAQRHWHTAEDELVYVLEGEVVLESDAGERALRAGEFAGFPAGHADAHCLVNRSGEVAKLLEIGARRGDDECHYPDIDLHFAHDATGGARFTHKDGTPW